MSIGFTIEALGFKESGMFHVDGRVTNGLLKVGQEFTSQVNFGEKEKRESLSLRILSIEAYGKSLNEIDSGMTCRITFQGSKITQSLKLGWVLTND